MHLLFILFRKFSVSSFFQTILFLVFTNDFVCECAFLPVFFRAVIQTKNEIKITYLDAKDAFFYYIS